MENFNAAPPRTASESVFINMNSALLKRAREHFRPRMDVVIAANGEYMEQFYSWDVPIFCVQKNFIFHFYSVLMNLFEKKFSLIKLIRRTLNTGKKLGSALHANQCLGSSDHGWLHFRITAKLALISAKTGKKFKRTQIVLKHAIIKLLDLTHSIKWIR